MHFTSSDSFANLPSNYQFVAGDLGTHSFVITLNTAGTQSITVTDTVTSLVIGAQTEIEVLPQMVVPEYPLAGLAAIFSCFGTFVVFKKRDSIVSFSKQ